MTATTDATKSTTNTTKQQLGPCHQCRNRDLALLFIIMTTKTIFDIWTCVFCKVKDALSLEMQFLDGDDVLFFDDPLAWYRCDNCATAAHFGCLLAKLKIYISYSDFRKDRRFNFVSFCSLFSINFNFYLFVF